MWASPVKCLSALPVVWPATTSAHPTPVCRRSRDATPSGALWSLPDSNGEPPGLQPDALPIALRDLASSAGGLAGTRTLLSGLRVLSITINASSPYHFLVCAPGRARTCNPRIKSPLR